EQATYGLTEWMDEVDVPFISNPGCFPTTVLLGLAPLVQKELIDENMIIIDAKTGVRGAGKGASQATHFPETNDNFKIYKVNEQQHTPEIEQELQKWNENIGPVTFTTHLAPMTRGIMATMYVTAKEKTTTEALVDLFTETYNDDNFVRDRDVGVFPTTKDVSGSNFCGIRFKYDECTKSSRVVSVIDNLVKGALDQAVKNMYKLSGFN